MTSSWREAYRLHRWAYPELAYQAIYAVRQGNLPPAVPPQELARRARRRVVQSKLLVSGLLGFFALGSIEVLSPLAETFLAPTLGRPLYVATVLSAVLILEIALLWWTGLQVLPTFLSSGIVPTLETLPIDAKSVDRAAFLLFARLFDAPVATALVLTPLAVGTALGSPLAGLAIVPGVLSAVVVALALSLATGKFFVRHVQGSPGGGSRTVLRWTYLLLWATPAFAMYGFITVGPRFMAWLSTLVASGPSAILTVLLAAFPYPFAALPSLVAFHGAAALANGPLNGPLSILGSAAYLGVAIFLGTWLTRAPRALSRTVSEGRVSPLVPVRLSPRAPAVAVLLKDVRIASRTPGFAFLILLPILDAAAIGVWTLASAPGPSDVFNIASAAVATAALLATFFGPAFFAIEVMGYSYTRALPLSERSLLGGKVGLIGALYAVSAGTVLGLALTRLFNPGAFLAFIAAEFPAVVAAALLELGILLEVARRRGLPITNLYSGGWWATGVGVPGLLVAGAPLLAFEAARSASVGTGLAWMALVSTLELAVAVGLTLLKPSRGLG